MPDPMRIRAVAQDDGVAVRVLIAHEMAGGAEPHFIEQVTVTHRGRVVLSAQWGPSVAKNPVLFFRFAEGRRGDELEVTWTDNRGARRTDRTTIE